MKKFLAIFTSFLFAHVGLLASFAPDSLAGLSVVDTAADGTVYGPLYYGEDGINRWGDKSRTYQYEKISANTGKITYLYEDEPNPLPEITTVTFLSPNDGTYTWAEYSDDTFQTIVDQDSGTFYILDAEINNLAAPQSIVGKTIQILDDNYSFTADEVYIIINDPNTILGGFSYSYVSNSATSATLEISGNSNGVTVNEVHQLTFTSPTRADSNYTATDGNGSLTLQILEENHVPNSLAGWTYKGSSMDDTLQFIDSSNAVFYDSSDNNFSRRELSNITYNLEQLGPTIAKLSTSLDEETLLFFDSNTSGHFDWKEMGGEDGVSGKFDLYYYASGHALDSLVGSSITLGETTYIFTSTNTVTVHSPNEETTSQEYSYLKESEDEGILSVGSSLWKLDFYNHQYGRIIEGGSGYFSIHHKWATKGWVYYDELPWIYSNNQGEWLYQVLSVNSDSNETELMYFEPWANDWSRNLDLNYTDQRIFSADSEFYWDDYDDFSGSSLDTNKWGSKYLGGGIEPYVSGGKLILSATSGNPSATKVVKSGWEDIFQGDDGGQAWVYPKDTEIVGIEAEFLIPSSTSSMSGLALGVASLSPLSYATAELNADPNSDSQYAQGFGFYHLTNDGSEVENFGTTQRDTTHRLGATLIDGVIKLYVDGEIRYQGEAGTFNTDMFYINGFNDYNSNGLPFVLNADNVRVLRKKSYPKGWMWTDYYPWAYSHETGGWLYFELAKDSAGNPVMNYYDHNTKAWDLYGPSLNQFYDR